jgi:hypothetical protein
MLKAATFAHFNRLHKTASHGTALVDQITRNRSTLKGQKCTVAAIVLISMTFVLLFNYAQLGSSHEFTQPQDLQSTGTGMQAPLGRCVCVCVCVRGRGSPDACLCRSGRGVSNW